MSYATNLRANSLPFQKYLQPSPMKPEDQTSYSFPLLSRLCLIASQLSFASPKSIFVPGM